MLVEGDFGMNVNEKLKDGRTPLDVAELRGLNAIIAYLKSKGAKTSHSLLYYN